MFETATQEQTNLELESMQLDQALTRLSVYESLLGLNSSTSAITIRSDLLELQLEFFKQEPDCWRLPKKFLRTCAMRPMNSPPAKTPNPTLL